MNPVFVAPEAGPWPVHDAASSRRAEAAALAAALPGALMQRAGLSVARLALALAPHARQVDVFSGPGNNGGDGLVAATHLHLAGKTVRVTLLADAKALPTDAATALQAAQQAGVAITDTLPGHVGGLAIDALLGLGARRPATGAIAAAMTRLNEGPAPVLSVDMPSGLHADTGVALGGLAVRASATLSLLTLKPGLFTGHGRDHAGAVWLDTLDADGGGASAWLAGPGPSPVRQHVQHKGSFGDVAVVGGAPGMSGAAWLAARAALAAGAGRVYCSLLDDDAPMLDAVRPELMGRRRWWTSAPEVLENSTVVCGCGGGDSVRGVLPPLLAHAARLLLDADALNAVAIDPALQSLLAARGARGRPTVLTPHPLEAARLLDCSAAAVQEDRLAAAARLRDRFGVVVVLKGTGSIVVAPGALPSINPTGNALLATAGTGDVLAGWIAGLWAQQEDALGSAMQGVWQHGLAADRAAASGRRRPLPAADLIGAMAMAASL